MSLEQKINELASAVHALTQQGVVTVEEIERLLRNHIVEDSGKAGLLSALSAPRVSKRSRTVKLTDQSRSFQTGCPQEGAFVALFNIASGRARFRDYDLETFYRLISPYVSAGIAPFSRQDTTGVFQASFIRDLLTSIIAADESGCAIVILRMAAYTKTKVEDFEDMDVWLAEEHDLLVTGKQIDPVPCFAREAPH